MNERSLAEASRRRRAAAAAADAAIVGAVAWLRGRGAPNAGVKAGRVRALRLVPAEALREQLRTPGQRLLGLRTVDRRTGERVALWRTVLLTAIALGGRQLAGRLAPPERTPEQEGARGHYLDDLRAIHERHPVESPERSAELRELNARYPGPVPVDLARMLAPSLAAALVTSRLRRRLAPTIEVLARPR